MSLEELRTKIESIDTEILNLIDQRTNLAKAIQEKL